jgi:HK97 family phage major capsid protein
MARSVVAPLLNRLDLPEFGMSVEEPKVGSGPSVAMHTELGTMSETDPVTELLEHPIRTIAGTVDMSRQAFERSSPQLDQVIAVELGAAYGELLDSQLINGSGSGQNLLGLLNVSGIASRTTSLWCWPILAGWRGSSRAWPRRRCCRQESASSPQR